MGVGIYGGGIATMVEGGGVYGWWGRASVIDMLGGCLQREDGISGPVLNVVESKSAYHSLAVRLGLAVLPRLEEVGNLLSLACPPCERAWLVVHHISV